MKDIHMYYGRKTIRRGKRRSHRLKLVVHPEKRRWNCPLGLLEKPQSYSHDKEDPVFIFVPFIIFVIRLWWFLQWHLQILSTTTFKVYLKLIYFSFQPKSHVKRPFETTPTSLTPYVHFLFSSLVVIKGPKRIRWPTYHGTITLPYPKSPSLRVLK